MNRSERLAKAVVEAVITGSQMVYREDQSRGGYDFDLHRADGRVAAVEVTTSTNQRLEGTYAAILNPRHGGSEIRGTECKRGWYIHPASDASINRIRSEVGQHLAALEAQGIEHFSDFFACQNESVRVLTETLRVTAGDRVEWNEPGLVVMGLPGGGGAVGPSMATDAVQREVLKDDNRRKLGSSGALERHLVVYVSQMNFLSWCGLIDFAPPEIEPDLPDEITHVWAFGETRDANHCAVWHASQGVSWQNAGPVAVAVGSVGE